MVDGSEVHEVGRVPRSNSRLGFAEPGSPFLVRDRDRKRT